MGKRRRSKHPLSQENSPIKTSKQRRLEDCPAWSDAAGPEGEFARPGSPGSQIRDFTEDQLLPPLTSQDKHFSQSENAFSSYFLTLFGEHCVITGETIIYICQQLNSIIVQLDKLNKTILPISLCPGQDTGPHSNCPERTRKLTVPDTRTCAEVSKGTSRCLMRNQIMLEVWDTPLNKGRWTNKQHVLNSLGSLLCWDSHKIDLLEMTRLPWCSHLPRCSRVLLKFKSLRIPRLLYEEKYLLEFYNIFLRRVFSDMPIKPLIPKNMLKCPLSASSEVPRTSLGQLPSFQLRDNGLQNTSNRADSPSAKSPGVPSLLSELKAATNIIGSSLVKLKSSHPEPRVEIHPSRPSSSSTQDIEKDKGKRKSKELCNDSPLDPSVSKSTADALGNPLPGSTAPSPSSGQKTATKDLIIPDSDTSVDLMTLVSPARPLIETLGQLETIGTSSKKVAPRETLPMMKPEAIPTSEHLSWKPIDVCPQTEPLSSLPLIRSSSSSTNGPDPGELLLQLDIDIDSETLPNEAIDGFKVLPRENQNLVLKKVEALRQELMTLVESPQPKSTLEGPLSPQGTNFSITSLSNEPTIRIKACKGRISPYKEYIQAELPTTTYTPVDLMPLTSPLSTGAQFTRATQRLQDDQPGHDSRGYSNSSQSSTLPQLFNIQESRQRKEPLTPLQVPRSSSNSAKVSVDIHNHEKLSDCPMVPLVLLEPSATLAADNLSGVVPHEDSPPLNSMMCAPLLSAN